VAIAPALPPWLFGAPALASAPPTVGVPAVACPPLGGAPPPFMTGVEGGVLLQARATKMLSGASVNLDRAGTPLMSRGAPGLHDFKRRSPQKSRRAAARRIG